VFFSSFKFHSPPGRWTSSFDKQKERTSRLASFYGTIRRKNIGECGSPLFASYLCHRGMAARVVGNIVLRFCLAVSEFSAIQSVVLHCGTPVRTELTRTRPFDYARRSTVPRWKKAYGTIAVNNSSGSFRDSCCARSMCVAW